MPKQISVFFCCWMVLLVHGTWPETTRAANIRANWDAVTQDVQGNPETIGYYRLYYGTQSKPGHITHPSETSFQYQHSRQVGNLLNVEIDGLTEGQTYYFAVVAVDVGGNISDYSSEVSKQIPVPEDGGIQEAGAQETGIQEQTQVDNSVPSETSQTLDNGQHQETTIEPEAGVKPETGLVQEVDPFEPSSLQGSCGCQGATRLPTSWLLFLVLVWAWLACWARFFCQRYKSGN